MLGLANASKHLVPSTFKTEVLKVNRHGVKCPFYAVHIKARTRDKLLEELRTLEVPGVQIARFGVPYVF